jgi:mycothiol system anti-sigma-R factor
MDDHTAHGHSKREGDLRAGPLPEEALNSSECQEALDTLYHFLDGELNEERRHQIQDHLDECSPCLEAFDFEAELKMVIARRCKEAVPEALRVRISILLEQASISFPGPEDGAQTPHPHDHHW